MKDKKDKSIKDNFLEESDNSAGLDVTAVPVLFSADIYPACIPNTACIRNTGKKVNHYIFGVKKASSASIQDSDCEALKCSLENSNNHRGILRYPLEYGFTSGTYLSIKWRPDRLLYLCPEK